MTDNEKQSFSRRTLLAFIGTSLVGTLSPVRAQQAWPSKNLTFIVGYPPGGGADLMARLVGQKMSATLGQTIIVDNRPGTAGQIGTTAASRSDPDGYTVLIDAASYAINMAIYPKLPYSHRSFETVGVIARVPLALVVYPGFPAKSVHELIEIVKRKPKEVFYASSGLGSLMHITTSMFMAATRTEMTHVPYRGGGPAITDVMGGQVSVYFCNAAAALPHIKAGKLRALAVTGSTRSTALPDVPTITQAGVNGVEIYEWNGMHAPAGTPAVVLDRISVALRQALDEPDVRHKLAQVAAEPFPGDRADAIRFVDAEVARFAELTKEFAITVE